MEVFKEWVKAGRSNLMQGYGSTIAISDFLHSAELLTDQAYQDIRLLADVMALATTAQEFFGGLFGNGALGPTLRSVVEQTSGIPVGESGEEAIGSMAANSAALSAAIQLVQSEIG